MYTHVICCVDIAVYAIGLRYLLALSAVLLDIVIEGKRHHFADCDGSQRSRRCQNDETLLINDPLQLMN
jgi:hypothetical protein